MAGTNEIITIDFNENTEWVKLNNLQNNFKLSILVEPSTDFDGTYTVEFDPSGTPGNHSFDHSELTAETGKKTSNLFFPVRYIRLTTSGGSVGTINVWFLQGA